MRNSKVEGGVVEIDGFGAVHKDNIRIVLRVENHRGQLFILVVYSEGPAEAFPDDPDLVSALARHFSFKDLTISGNVPRTDVGLHSAGGHPRLTFDSLRDGNATTLLVYENSGRDMSVASVNAESVEEAKEQKLPHYSIEVLPGRIEISDKNGVVDASKPSPHRTLRR